MPLGLDANFYGKVLPVVVLETGLFAYAFASDLRTCQVTIGLLGLWWCFAALWVEVQIEHAYPGFQWDDPVDPSMQAYRPFCDFAPWATCSKVLMSPKGRFLRYFGIAKPLPEGAKVASLSPLDRVRWLIDVPNPTLGVAFFACHLFYPALLLIPIITSLIPSCFFLACCGVGCMTCWLAYNLFFQLRDFCVVCVSMYVANFALIPMMYGICQLHRTSIWDFAFFGAFPRWLLLPFLAMDAVMGAAVLALWLRGPAHEQEGDYSRLPATGA